MSIQVLMKYGKIATLVAAVLLLLGGVLIAILPDGGLSGPAASLVYYAALISGCFAIITIYLNQAERAGRLGFIGFILSIVGSIIYSAPVFVLIAGTSGIQSWHDIWGFAMGNALLVGPGALFIGMICLGVATTKAGVYPKPAGWLIIAGAVIWLVAFTLLPFMLVIGTSLVAAGLAWTGLVSANPEFLEVL